MEYYSIILSMDLFKEGQKLTLFFQKDTTMVEMTCSIEKVLDDRINLILPQYFMRYVEFLQVGNELTAKAFSKFGTIDFNTIIISSPMEDCFSIEIDYNALRLTSGKDIPMIEAVENLKINIQGESLNLKTFEISTEYIKFNSDKQLNLNEEFEGVLYLPADYGIITFKAVVSEIDPIYETEHTAMYTMMTESDRQTLLYYMYMYSKDID